MRASGDPELVLFRGANRAAAESAWTQVGPLAATRDLVAIVGASAGMRVGVVREASGEGVEPGVRDAVRASLDRLTALGAAVDEVSLPHADYALSAYYLIAPSEASSNLARFDGVRYGLRVDGTDSIDMMTRTRGAGFGAEVKRRIMLGTYALSAGYYEAYYGQAQKVRTLIIRDYEQAFERFDVLVSPTSPSTAFRIGERADDPLAMYAADLLTMACFRARDLAVDTKPDFTPVTETDRAVEAILAGRAGLSVSRSMAPAFNPAAGAAAKTRGSRNRFSRRSWPNRSASCDSMGEVTPTPPPPRRPWPRRIQRTPTPPGAPTRRGGGARATNSIGTGGRSVPGRVRQWQPAPRRLPLRGVCTPSWQSRRPTPA